MDEKNGNNLDDIVSKWLNDNHEYISFCVLVYFIGFLSGIFIPLLIK